MILSSSFFVGRCCHWNHCCEIKVNETSPFFPLYRSESTEPKDTGTMHWIVSPHNIHCIRLPLWHQHLKRLKCSSHQLNSCDINHKSAHTVGGKLVCPPFGHRVWPPSHLHSASSPFLTLFHSVSLFHTLYPTVVDVSDWCLSHSPSQLHWGKIFNLKQCDTLPLAPFYISSSPSCADPVFSSQVMSFVDLPHCLFSVSLLSSWLFFLPLSL